MSELDEIDLPTQIEWVRNARVIATDIETARHWGAVEDSLEAQAMMARIALSRCVENTTGPGISPAGILVPADESVDHADDPGVQTASVQVCPSGSRLEYLTPKPEQILIPDMAHHLARIPRFGGGSDCSVAQHVVVGSRLIAEQLLARCFLMHDAEEYVMGDMASPLKKLVGPRYKEIANGLRAAIFAKVGLPIEWAHALPREVKEVDELMLHWERRDQMPTVDWIEKRELVGYGEYLPWDRRQAEIEFMQRFGELWPDFQF